MIEIVLPVLVATGIGVGALVFLKFKKPQIVEEGWFEEDIPLERQPTITSQCGEIIGATTPNSKGENFHGKIIKRKTYKDNWCISIYNEQQKRSFELKDLHYGINIRIMPNSELIAGHIHLITNVDANGDLCEWDMTNSKIYKKQYDSIQKERGRGHGLQKIKEIREDRNIIKSPHAKTIEEDEQEENE